MSIQLKGNLTYKSKPIQITDKRTTTLRNKTIPLVKIVWQGLTPEEATWELEEDVRRQYPNLIN